jgi:hypothetical protein
MASRRQTQKPAAHFCGRALGATNDFEQITTTHWTSQVRFDLVLHKRCKSE